MSYLKAILLSAVVAVAIIFMVQNMEALSQPLAIHLNLLFVQFESAPYATYLVILLAFFVGLLAASLLGLVERYRLRRDIKALNKEIASLNQELSSLRNLPITGEPSSQPDNRRLPEAEEQAL
ncbi:MAG: LapA family protein [Desulfarculus sp.]|nr:LapA family protein [Desulfarculus sp.]